MRILPLPASVRLTALMLGIAFGPGAAAPGAAKSGPGFADETSRIHYPRDRSVDFLDMALDLSFDWERRWVGGEVSFTLTPIAEPVRTVTLDAAELRVSSVTAAGGELEFEIIGEQIRVDLGREAVPGEEVGFTIAYEANPRKGLFFSGETGSRERPPQIWTQGEAEDSHHWFPCYDYPNDRLRWEQRLTVREDWKALGNGELVGVTQNRGEGTKTWHYRQEVPAVTYLVSVAIGDFDIHEEEWDGIPIEHWVPAGTPAETVRRSFGRTADMMRFFSEFSGVRYPYPKYAHSTVSDYTFGGMENLSAATLTLHTLHPERSEPQGSSHGLVAHELAHQWWGDLLTCRDWAHAWLNEGFATYFDALYVESRRGTDEFQYEMLKNARDYFEEDENDYRRSIVHALYTDPFDLFDDHLYPKGSWTLHMLRGVVGDDLFRKTIRAYAREYSARNVTTEDLRRTFEEVTGRSLVWFFDEWYDHGGHPEYRLRQEWDDGNGWVRLEVEQAQEEDGLTPLFRMPVRIAFSGDGWEEEFRVEIDRQRREFTFPLPGPPRMTRFDAGQWVLKKLEFERTREELAFQLRNDPDVAGRIWAAEQLGERSADPGAATALADALRAEPFWGVRVEIAGALGALHLSETRDALVEASGDPDPRVRAAALQGLGRYEGDGTAAAAIRSAYGSEENDYVLKEAVKAYAATRIEDAFSFLRSAAKRSSYREKIAEGAYEAMAELGDERAIAVLKEGARRGRPRYRRDAAIKALGKLARDDGRDRVVGFLIDLLEDPSVFARRSAIEALGESRSARAVPPLESAARHEWDSRLRREARKSIRKINES